MIFQSVIKSPRDRDGVIVNFAVTYCGFLFQVAPWQHEDAGGRPLPALRQSAWQVAAHHLTPNCDRSLAADVRDGPLGYRVHSAEQTLAGFFDYRIRVSPVSSSRPSERS